MPIKTSLPSQKRIFWLFLTLAFLVSTSLYAYIFRPSASETASYDSTVPQATQPTGNCQADIIFAPQTSGSFNQKPNANADNPDETRLDTAVDAIDFGARLLANNSGSGDRTKARVGLITYFQTPNVDPKLSIDLTSLYAKLNEMTYQDGPKTTMGAIIEAARTEFGQNGRGAGIKRILVLIGDGDD